MTTTTDIRRTAVWPVVSVVALLAGITAAGIGALSLADALAATGLPDPGPVTTLGLPFVRAAGEIAGVLAVGAFLFAAFFAPPQENGVLDVAGYRALRLGTVASGVWTVCAALLVPLTISDVSGQPLRDHLNPVQLWSLAGLVDTANAWRWTACLALIVTAASVSTKSRIARSTMRASSGSSKPRHHASSAGAAASPSREASAAAPWYADGGSMSGAW